MAIGSETGRSREGRCRLQAPQLAAGAMTGANRPPATGAGGLRLSKAGATTGSGSRRGGGRSWEGHRLGWRGRLARVGPAGRPAAEGSPEKAQSQRRPPRRSCGFHLCISISWRSRSDSSE